MNRREFSQLTAVAALGHVVRRGSAQTTPSPSQIRFSVMLWALVRQLKISLEQAIDIAAAAGFNGVELTGEFYKWSPDDTSRITSKMKTLGLVVDAMSGVKAGFAVPEQSTDFMTQMEAEVKWAKQLNCPQIILLSGKRVDGLSPAMQYQTSVDNLKRAADLVSKENIQIVIEPNDPLENPTIFMSSVSDAFQIVRTIGSEHVKVLYDVYHEQRAFGNLIEKFVNNIGYVGLVHIADVPGRHEPGTGEINYENIYRKLAELKYDKWIAMEFYPTEDPVTTLKKARLAALQALGS